jgi:hypothetical protein
VFGLYIDEVADKKILPNCTQGYFNACWRRESETKLIKCRRHLRFAKCADCVAFRDRRKRTRGPTALNQLRDEIRLHHNMVKSERKAYYQRGLMACLEPNHYLSLIIDGADQSRFGLPHFAEADHSCMSLWRIHTYLMGVLNHGRQPMAITYLPNIKQGTNVTTDCFHYAILRTYARFGRIPKVAFLQIDNTAKQCKSKYMMGFAGYLVHIGVFREVVISFLPVGHTHEDIDQFFSRISVYLQQHDALSRPALAAAVRAAYCARSKHVEGYKKKRKAPMDKSCVDTGDAGDAGRRATVLHRDTAANMSDWLESHITNLKGRSGNSKFSDHRQFRIYNRPAPGGGSQVHVDARLNADGHYADKQFSGMDLYASSTPLFRYDVKATRDFLALPPFTGVPPAQRSAPKRYEQQGGDEKRDKEENRQKSDVNKCMKRRPGGFTPEDKADLAKVLEIIDQSEPAEFDWDITLYQEMYASRDGQEVHGANQAELELKRITAEYALGSRALVTADGDSDEGFWIGTVKEHSLEGKVRMSWYNCINANDGEFPIASKRVYMPNVKRESDWVWKHALQAPDMEFKKRSKKKKLDSTSAKVLAYWLDMRRKKQEREDMYDESISDDMEPENDIEDDDNGMDDE